MFTVICVLVAIIVGIGFIAGFIGGFIKLLYNTYKEKKHT